MATTKEEYLIQFENRLVDLLTDIFKNQNKNLFTIYILTTFYVLFVSGLIKEVNVFGNKLELDIGSLRIFMPFVLLSIFVFINYQTIRISKIIYKIRLNSEEIQTLNNEARPLSTGDIFYFSSGLLGLILAFSRWQFTSMLKNKFLFSIKDVFAENTNLMFIIKFSVYIYRLTNWLVWSMFRFILIAGLYIFPLIIVLINVSNNPISPEFTRFYKILCISILGFTILATIISIIILLLTYLNDLIISFKKEFGDTLTDFRTGIFNKSISFLIDIVLRTWPFY